MNGTEPKPKTLQEEIISRIAICVLAGIAFLCWRGYSNLTEFVSPAATEARVSETYTKTASDAIDLYVIASRNKRYMDACVQARIISRAYLAAKNEQQYNSWKDAEAFTCKLAYGG